MNTSNTPVDFQDPAYEATILAINPLITVEELNGIYIAEYKDRYYTLGSVDDFVFWTIQQKGVDEYLEDEYHLLNVYAQEQIELWNRGLEEAITKTKELYESYKIIAKNLDAPLQDDAMATIAKLNKMYIMLRYQKRDAA